MSRTDLCIRLQLCCMRPTVLVGTILEGKKFLHVLFHVDVADIPEHGTGHVGFYWLPLVVKLTP